MPCEDWLRSLMNRIDPALFSACFSSWVSEQFPSAAPEMIAIDGKTSRRSHDRAAGKRALHLVSAFASHGRLVLGQEAVDEKSNEIKAIPSGYSLSPARRNPQTGPWASAAASGVGTS